MAIDKNIISPFIVDVMSCKNIKNRKEPVIGIYKITSIDGKIYIGQASDIENRLYHAYKNLLCKKQKLIYESIILHGIENHTFEIIHTIPIYDRYELNKLEVHYIKLFDTYDSPHGLNQTKGGDHSGKHSEETKEKIRLKNIGKTVSESTREKIRLKRKGTKHTEESKRKNSEYNKGDKNGFFGKKHSKETNKNNSEWHKINQSGKNHPFYGKNHTHETKKKISVSNTGKKRSDNFKNNLSIIFSGSGNPMYGSNRIGSENPMFGKSHSSETIKKISEANSLKINQYSLDGVFIKTWDNAKTAGSELNIHQTSILKACKCKFKTGDGNIAKGFIWKYA